MPDALASSTRDAFPRRAITSTIRRWFIRRKFEAVAITGNVHPRFDRVKVIIDLPSGCRQFVSSALMQERCQRSCTDLGGRFENLGCPSLFQVALWVGCG